MYENYERLIVSVEDGVALVTINRPEKMNSMDARLSREIREIWRDLDADPDVRISVVTGAGDRAFSAGGDLKEGQHRETLTGDDYFLSVMEDMQGASDLVYNMVNSVKPIISAINGVAVGAGLVVAMMADISIMAEEARLIDGHTPIGLTAGDHSTMIWPLLCGMAKAKYYLLTSDPIDGKEAERIGLVSRVVSRAELMSTTMELAKRLAAGPQHALRMTKRSLNQWLRLGGVVSFDYSLSLEMLNYFSGDYKAGVQAFVNKEKPVFPSASSPAAPAAE
ncbi:MAG: enoyl-CoA hydratase [Chloroflexota bacterium]|nr:enoyl-CoA hydratase [Chloroflexota bacterium]